MTGLEAAFEGALDCLETEGLTYAVIGALARNAWARPRASTDVDFAVALGAGGATRLRDALESRGFTFVREHTVEPADDLPDLLFLRAPDGVRVDFLVAKTEFEEAALSRAHEARVGDRLCRVVSPEDLVVYKVVAGRTRDLADVEEVVQARIAAGEAFDWAHVEKWVADFGYEDRLARVRARLGV
jgi:hypothetical protein